MQPEDTTAPPRKHSPWLRAVVDYGGLTAFALAYFMRLKLAPTVGGLGWALSAGSGAYDLTGATWWLVGGSVLALLVGLIAERRLAPLPLIVGLFAVVFGSLTLAFHDPRIIKVKYTATNLLFAVGLFGGLLMGKNPLKALLGESLPLPDTAWRTLTIRYGTFFAVMAGLNELIWRTQPDKRWMLFHFPGGLILALLFSASQAPLMMKYLHTHESPPPPTE